MVKYVHLKKTLMTGGAVVRLDELNSFIDDKDSDYYRSAYYYDESIDKLFKESGSVKGFEGVGYTEHLHWDIDCEDLNEARQHTLNLVEYLGGLGFSDSIDVFFSGSKGFHVLLNTQETFNHLQTTQICQKIAAKAGVNIDVVVYNVTRAFRIPNTKHQTSGLFKVQLEVEELDKWSVDEILKYAGEPQELLKPVPESASSLLELYEEQPEITYDSHDNVRHISDFSGDFNIDKCPKGMRRCIYKLENGLFGPGERENALIRIAAYYSGQGKDRDFTFSVLDQALRKRETIYPNAKPFDHVDTERILGEVFSPGWKGGTFTCKTDAFLQLHCDQPGHCTGHKESETKSRKRTVVGIADLCDMYRESQLNAPAVYPKFGLSWLDERIFIRPKDFSIVIGANGSGKTSLIVEIMENLNAQKMHHIMFSMDMSDLSMFLKLAARYSRHSLKEIEDFHNPNHESYSETECKKIATILQRRLPYTHFDFSSSHDIEDLGEVVKSVEKETGEKIHIAFVDYAGRLMGGSESSYVNATRNASVLNDIAKETNAHWMILSQISREHGDHTEPLYSNRIAKDSGAWEENATFTINVWRPLGKSDFSVPDNGYHIFIGKNRKGIGYCEMAFNWNGKAGKIRHFEKIEEQEYAANYFSVYNQLPPTRLLGEMDLDAIETEGNEIAADNNSKESDAAYVRRTSGKADKPRRSRRFGS